MNQTIAREIREIIRLKNNLAVSIMDEMEAIAVNQNLDAMVVGQVFVDGRQNIYKATPSAIGKSMQVECSEIDQLYELYRQYVGDGSPKVWDKNIGWEVNA